MLHRRQVSGRDEGLDNWLMNYLHIGKYRGLSRGYDATVLGFLLRLLRLVDRDAQQASVNHGLRMAHVDL